MAIRDKDKDRGKIGQTRVPEWADDENEEIEGDIRPTREAALEKAFPPQEEEEKEDTMPIVRKDDHLLLRRAEIVFVPTTEEEARRWEGLGLEEEDEDPFAERRRQIKEKGESLLDQIEEDFAERRRRRQIKEKRELLLAQIEEEEEEGEGEELSAVRPVFVPEIREGLELELEEEEEEEDTALIVRKDDHLLIRRAEFVPTIEEEARRREGLGLEEEDEDALAERRRQIKEKREALLAQKEEEEEEEEEEGEELSVVWPVYVPKIREEDALAERRRQIGEKNKKQEEALRQKLAMVEAWFVPKRERYTIAECEPLEAEEGALKKAKKRGLGSKSHKNMELEANIADVDIDDELNEAKEYEAWKVREIHRIKLDREVLRGNVKVRNMTRKR